MYPPTHTPLPPSPHHHRRQLLERPTKLALVKGESYGVCTRPQSPEPGSTPPPHDLMSGPEEMADLVGRILQERLAVATQGAQGEVQGEAQAGAQGGAEAMEVEGVQGAGAQQEGAATVAEAGVGTAGASGAAAAVAEKTAAAVTPTGADGAAAPETAKAS